MTLQEKFKELGSEWCYEISHLQSKEAEKLAENFAIGFYEWRSTTPIRNIDQYTNKECIEKYKKEKGL
jgi:hypothetical protein